MPSSGGPGEATRPTDDAGRPDAPVTDADPSPDQPAEDRDASPEVAAGGPDANSEAVTRVPDGSPSPVDAPGEPGAPSLGGAAERPRTKAAQGEATTAALTAAARALFAQRGYANVGTEEIAHYVGVTRGALYHHFKGGKEELFRAVVVQLSAEMARRVRGVARATDDPWDALANGIDAFLDACALPEIQRILLVDGPAVLGWDVWRTIDADYGLGLLEGALQRAIDAGRLPPQPARAAAHVLLGALDEAAMVVARADDPLTARQEMGQTVHRLLEGLRLPTP